MLHWMSQLFRSSSKQSRRPLSRRRPHRIALKLEQLEDRCVPSLMLRFSTDGGATFGTPVSDNGPGDLDPNPGTIAVNIGALTLNATVSGGTSTPVSVVSLQIQGTAAAGTYDLVVQASLDGLQTAPPPDTLTNGFTDSTLHSDNPTTRTWIDANNNLFGTGGAGTNIQLDTGDLATQQQTTYSFSASVPYSLTTQIHTTFTSEAGNETTLSIGDNNRITPSSMASPAITTSQQPANAFVGESIADTATVTGLVSPSSNDTVTFNLYNNPNGTGTPLFTDTEPLSISGSTGTATSAGYPTTATGTDYWVATFNGDSNNTAVTSGATAEPVTIVTASITITPNAVDPVNDAETFTITVTADPAGTTPSFALPTVSFPGATPGSVGPVTLVGVNGDVATYTVTIDSSTPGTFVIDASDVVTFTDGFGDTATVTTTSDGLGADSGPATKNFVTASITITPNAVDPVNEAETFTIQVTADPAATTPSFALPTVSFPGATPGSVGPVTFVSQAGDVATYTVTIDSATPGTFVIDASDVVTFTDGFGDTATVTTTTDGTAPDSGPATKNFVNASIVITPNAVDPVNDAETFTIQVTADPAGTTPSFALPTVSFPGATPGSVGPVTFVSQVGDVATYTVTIDSATPGTFVIDASDVVTFTDGFGDTATVTTTTDGVGADSGPATKNFVTASITITPNAVDPVNDAETFTIQVTADPAGTTPSFALPTVSFPGATPGSVGPVTLVGVNGDVATYTVTIDSSTPGTFVIDASDVVTFTDGFGDTATVTTTTDGVGADSGPATKNFVTASITITPNAVDPVNDAETFTITVTADPAGTTPSFALPTVSFPGATPGSVSPVTFVSQVGDVATYTVTIDSSTPGTFVIDASDVVTFTDGFGDTATVTTTTDGLGADSGPATKNFVTASITITPNAVDPVNDAETFTITVTADPASTTLSFALPTISFPGAPGSVGPVTFVSQVGDVATYTVTIDSATPGTFVIDASDVVTFTDGFNPPDSTTVTTTTDGTAPDSGPATKNFVNASITITPNAVDPVNDAETFTITVTADPAATTPSFALPTVSFPGATPGSVGPVTFVSQAGDVATYTVTIDSVATPGTFVIDASDVVTFHRRLRATRPR